MRAFLYLSLRFLVPPLCWFIAMICWNLHLLAEEDPGLHARSLAIGDSHVVCAMDTAGIPGLQNIGSTAEPLILSLWKLRYAVANHEVDTVIIGLGPHSLCEKSDRRLLDQGWATDELMRRTYAILPVCEALGAPIHLPTYLSTVFSQMCLSPKASHLRYFDGYTGIRRRFKANADSVLSRHYQEIDGSLAPFSETADDALDSLLTLCARHGIKVYIVGTPVHQTYSSGIPTIYRERYDIVCRQAFLRDAVILDHLDLFSGDSLFADADHLNSAGARRFSALIAGEIRIDPARSQSPAASSAAN